MGISDSATHCQWTWANVLPASFQSKAGASMRRALSSQMASAASSRMTATHFHFVR
jgi:hypothetical protein